MQKVSPQKQRAGFTLLEVLVAMVITGTVVVVFFQVLSAGLRLEYSAEQRTQEVVDLDQAFKAVLARDVRSDDFQWQGEQDGNTWELRIEEVDTQQTRAHTEDALQNTSELYRYVFEYQSRTGRKWTLSRYVQQEPGFFSEDFRRRYF